LLLSAFCDAGARLFQIGSSIVSPNPTLTLTLNTTLNVPATSLNTANQLIKYARESFG
jgi:hypothetical protein